MIKLYNDDTRIILPKIPSESVDLVITDVPYKLTQRGSSGTMGGYWKNDIAKKGAVFENNNIKPKEYMPELYRVLKDGTICYVMINNLNLQEMLNEGAKCGFHFVKSLIWDKMSKICGRYYMGCYEYILLFRKGKDRPIKDCSTPDILRIPIKKLQDEKGNNIHDTEKPVKLMDILVKNSSEKGDTVLDCFMGIGSVGVSSVKNGRNFIGCEIEKKIF